MNISVSKVKITSSIRDIQLEGFGFAKNVEVFENTEEICLADEGKFL